MFIDGALRAKSHSYKNHNHNKYNIINILENIEERYNRKRKFIQLVVGELIRLPLEKKLYTLSTCSQKNYKIMLYKPLSMVQEKQHNMLNVVGKTPLFSNGINKTMHRAHLWYRANTL